MKTIAIILILLIVFSGCNQQSEITVLPERAEGAKEFVENGGPGVTEATYNDGKGQQWNTASNVVSIPIQENCEVPDVVEFEDPDLPIGLPQDSVIPTTVAINSFQNQLYVSSQQKPDIYYKTDVFIPKNPPKIRLEKTTDEEILCCNEQLTFRIKFINEGGDDAYNIRITDLVPANVEYIEDSAGVTPFVGNIAIQRDYNEKAKKLEWLIEGPVPAGEEGEVYFSVSCPKKLPKLGCIVCLDPRIVSEGEEAFVVCSIENSGDAPATNARLYLVLPPEIDYVDRPGERELEFELGDIEPGQTVSKEFRIKMLRQTSLENIITTIVIDNGEGCECSFPPTATLLIEKSGPSQVNNGHPITNTIVVKNTSTKAYASNCVLVDKLPQGIIFKEASNGGTYDQASNVVTWQLGTLSPGAIETRTVTVEPTRAGDFRDEAEVSCDEGILVRDDATTIVKGYAAMHISKYDSNDPVAVGETTTYTIEVRNEGFKDATGVVLTNDIPELTEFVSAEAEDEHGVKVDYTVDGQKVTFNAVPLLASGEKIIYNVTVKATAKAQLLNRTSLRYDQFEKTIVVEEPTSTYE